MSLLGPPPQLRSWFGAGVPLVVESNVFQRLDSGDAADVDRFLLPQVQSLKREYQHIGDPHILYLAAQGLAATMRPVRPVERSFQYARLLSFLGEMLIAQGRDSRTLSVAADHLDRALDVLRNVSGVNSEVLRAHVQVELLAGIVHKALGDRDVSFRRIERAKRTITHGLGGSPVDVIPLTRQEVIMAQTVEGHRSLLENAYRYREVRPKEHYRSIKRAFEFSLNRGHRRDIETVVGEFIISFDRIADDVSPISSVSFHKNIGQYLILTGRIEDAVYLLTRTRSFAVAGNLIGQVRQIDRLISEARGGVQAPLLTAFAVA